MGAGRQKTPFPLVPQLPSPSCRTCPLSRLHPALGGQHQWASLPSGFLLGSANGRHQQEMKGWKGREAGVGLLQSLLALGLRDCSSPWAASSKPAALAGLHYHHSLPKPLLPRGGNSFLLRPALWFLSVLCCFLWMCPHLCKSSFTKWLFTWTTRVNGVSCQDSDW